MTRKTRPLLRCGPLSGEVIIVTRYTDKGKYIIAHEKYQVPDAEFEEAIRAYRKHKRAVKKWEGARSG